MTDLRIAEGVKLIEKLKLKEGEYSEFPMRPDYREILIAALTAAGEMAGETSRLKGVIEHDRSKVADILAEATAVLKSYFWLAEGRGSYAFDDDRWKDEFATCMEKIKVVLDPMRVIAGDLSDSPIKWADIVAARALSAAPASPAGEDVVEKIENIRIPISRALLEHFSDKEYEAYKRGIRVATQTILASIGRT